MTPALRYAALSDRGRVRADNEDRWSADPRQGLYILADGMGGHNAGALAAEIVTQTLPALLSRRLAGVSDPSPATLERELSESIMEVSEAIRENARDRPGLTGMGSTVVALLVRGDAAVVAHMGDSRLYRLRAGALAPLTRDHSVVRLLLDNGELTPEGVASHPARGVITRGIGMDAGASPDTLRIGIEPGDRLLMCSDGLTDTLSDEQIATILSEAASIDSACRGLITAANDAGGPDNITALVIEG